MKTILYFIGLKVAEITGAALIFTGFSYGFKLILCDLLGQKSDGFWANGIVGILFFILGGLIIVGIILVINEIIKKNIKWAKRLNKKG